MLLLIPLLYLAAVLLPKQLFLSSGSRWSAAPAVAAVAFLLSMVAAVLLWATGPVSAAVTAGAGPLTLGPLALSVRLDGVTVVMLLLVNAIGTIILRFSRRYLDGEAQQARYFRAFIATLAAVSLLVVTNNLGVLVLAWTASSVALHELLEFYAERTQALIAAHKKFLMARLADVALFGGVALLWRTTGTLEIDALRERAATWDTVPVTVQVAGVLLACGVALRSAQLPFHGWLIQVMEAPTPVSALLHAGIVNIGGFVMIRLAELMGQIGAAQLLLVVGGTMTATLAGLVMMTRVSVKVSLAWSTCAQMGFMLLECGLGAYSLALLHLVAHSLYKAHAFLSSGRAVELHVRRTMSAPVPRSGRAWLLGGAAALLLLATASVAFDLRADGEPTLLVMSLVLALALAPVLARAIVAREGAALPLVGAVIAIVLVYAVAHRVMGLVVAPVAVPAGTALIGSLFVAIAFLTLFVVQAVILTQPTGRLARALYPACFAGFYLDEIFTRLTFRLWPPAPVAPQAPGAVLRDSILTEVAA
jgi:NAD(P)H-quinone oxidoreductase subunit 5